jgi:hypothetical protein
MECTGNAATTVVETADAKNVLLENPFIFAILLRSITAPFFSQSIPKAFRSREKPSLHF